jgi:hypothetical protein
MIRAMSQLGLDRRVALFGCLLFSVNQLADFALLRAVGHRHADLLRWDAGWYARVARDGYEAAPQETSDDNMKKSAFFPLFPALARVTGAVTGMPLGWAGGLAGRLCFLAAIILFTAFVRDHQPGVHPAVSASVAALQPYAIYGNTGYTEPLFLAMSCAFFLLLRRRKFLRAGLAGALLTATRFVGLAALPAYAVACWRDRRAGRGPADATRLAGFLLIPLGLALFMLLLHMETGDALAFMHVQRAWGRHGANPVDWLVAGFAGDAALRYWAATGLAALILPLLLARRGWWELAVFSWSCTLAPLCTGVLSMPRFVWWQAPMLLLVALAASHRRVWPWLLALSLAGLAAAYVAWFSGDNLAT